MRRTRPDPVPRPPNTKVTVPACAAMNWGTSELRRTRFVGSENGFQKERVARSFSLANTMRDAE